MRVFIACALMLFTCSSASAAVFAGNANSGFGGVIGTGMLEFTNTGSTLDGKLTRGAGNLNDSIVLYVDSQAGGFTTTGTFDDAADDLRKAISGFDGANRSTVNFAAGLEADYAIAIDQGFAGLWSLSGTGSHGFVSSAALTPTGDAAAAMHSFSIDLSSIGLNPGDSFNFVGTYLNENGAFRSNEAFGDGLAAFTQGPNTATFTNSLTFTSAAAVPEPSSAIALIGMTGVFVMRRKR